MPTRHMEQGEEWKALRKRFNPGFSTQHIMTLLPSIVDKTQIFVSRLERLVQIEQIFSLQDLAIDFTFDFMGTLVLDVDIVTSTGITLYKHCKTDHFGG